MINKTLTNIINWPYKNPPTVHDFIKFYGMAALEAAGVDSLDDIKDEIFQCAMLRITVEHLTPGAYYVWKHANRVSGRTLKECTRQEIENQVERYYEKLRRELIKHGPEILVPPPKLLGGHDPLAEHKKDMAKRGDGWKVSRGFEVGMSELQKIRDKLKG